MLCEITENTIIQYFLCVQKLLWDGKTEVFIEMLDFLEKKCFSFSIIYMYDCIYHAFIFYCNYFLEEKGDHEKYLDYHPHRPAFLLMSLIHLVRIHTNCILCVYAYMLTYSVTYITLIL